MLHTASGYSSYDRQISADWSKNLFFSYFPWESLETMKCFNSGVEQVVTEFNGLKHKTSFSSNFLYVTFTYGKNTTSEFSGLWQIATEINGSRHKTNKCHIQENEVLCFNPLNSVKICSNSLLKHFIDSKLSHEK